MREDKLAQQMFYGGCAFLPWLWIVNVLYFRKAVYGPIPLVDYFPGGDRRQAALDRFADGSAYDDDEEDGPIENMPQVGGSGSDDTDAETDFGDDDDGGGDGSGDNGESRVRARRVQRGVEKWVKRSTMSASFSSSVASSRSSSSAPKTTLSLWRNCSAHAIGRAVMLNPSTTTGTSMASATPS